MLRRIISMLFATRDSGKSAWQHGAVWAIGVAAALIVCAPLVRTQTAPATPSASAPVPRHDISGIWIPARGPGDGIGGRGARDFPEDGRPEHQLPYTAMALEKMKTYK